MALRKAAYGCGVTVLTFDEPDAAGFADAVAKEAAQTDAGFALFFLSPSLMDTQAFADRLRRAAPELAHAGCTTAGEITPAGMDDGQAVAMLLPADRFRVVSAMVPSLSTTGLDAIAATVEGLKREIGRRDDRGDVFALCFIDGLSRAEEAVSLAIHWGLEDIPLVGGSAGDDLRFERTSLFSNGTVASDSAIIMLVATDVPFRVLKTDNFVPTTEKLVVTRSDPDNRLVHEFNAGPAASEYAAAVGVDSGSLTPLSFASYPVVVRIGGEHYCRSIRKLEEDGSLSFFCAIDDGIVLTVARATDMVRSTSEALREVGASLGGIDMILGFDCVLRRLDAQNRQVSLAMSELYRDNHVVGFGTYGEQYRSMHLNQTFTGIAFGPVAEAAG